MRDFYFISNLAERVRFELTVPRGTTVFKTVAIDHSATFPFYSEFSKGWLPLKTVSGIDAVNPAPDLSYASLRSTL